VTAVWASRNLKLYPSPKLQALVISTGRTGSRAKIAKPYTAKDFRPAATASTETEFRFTRGPQNARIPMFNES